MTELDLQTSGATLHGLEGVMIGVDLDAALRHAVSSRGLPPLPVVNLNLRTSIVCAWIGITYRAQLSREAHLRAISFGDTNLI